MSEVDYKYNQLLNQILNEGIDSDDRTGVGTKSVFGTQLKTSLAGGVLPALSLRKVAPRIAFEELMFMLNGKRQTKELEAKGINIWKGNTSREFLDKRGLDYVEEGDFGRMYGVQLREFIGLSVEDKHSEQHPLSFDQLKYMEKAIRDTISKPNCSEGRRIIATHYNPAESDQGALFPCHIMTQFNVRDGKLDCLFWMRSSDVGYGLPYNLMYYGMFTHLMAKLTGLEAGELIYQSGDCHLYKNQIDCGMIDYMRENVWRIDDHFIPKFTINKDVNTLEEMLELKWEDVSITDYKPLPDYKHKPKMAI